MKNYFLIWNTNNDWNNPEVILCYSIEEIKNKLADRNQNISDMQIKLIESGYTAFDENDSIYNIFRWK